MSSIKKEQSLSTITKQSKSDSVQKQWINPDALANELVNINKENAKLKKENKNAIASLKKTEKLLEEAKAAFMTKSDKLDKYKRENDDMSKILQAEQYKSIKQVEKEKSIVIEKYAKLESESIQMAGRIKNYE